MVEGAWQLGVEIAPRRLPEVSVSIAGLAVRRPCAASMAILYGKQRRQENNSLHVGLLSGRLKPGKEKPGIEKRGCLRIIRKGVFDVVLDHIRSGEVYY